MRKQEKKRRCLYCGKLFDGQMRFCSMECARQYEAEEKRDQPRIKYFVLGMILGIGVMFGGIFSGRQWAAGLGIGLMGLTITLLPFTTPETVEMLGYRRAKTAGRIGGIVTVLVGIWMGFL